MQQEGVAVLSQSASMCSMWQEWVTAASAQPCLPCTSAAQSPVPCVCMCVAGPMVKWAAESHASSVCVRMHVCVAWLLRAREAFLMRRHASSREAAL